jgi:serine/threonine protein kinase
MFIAKLTDFGYSRRYTCPTDCYNLPLSKPWEAPEVDGTDKKFSLQQAVQADIYSYALLCAWILFDYRFPEISIYHHANVSIDSMDSTDTRSIIAFQYLKDAGQIKSSVLDFVESDGNLEDSQRLALRELFNTAFAEERRAGSQTIWESFTLLKP